MQLEIKQDSSLLYQYSLLVLALLSSSFFLIHVELGSHSKPWKLLESLHMHESMAMATVKLSFHSQSSS